MVKTIDVFKLREMFIGAAKNLALYEEEINAHNVFPVPDGDTGTNMCATAQTAATELQSVADGDLNFAKFATVLTSASLRGARGNSGVILSQIYKGFAEGVGFKNILVGTPFLDHDNNRLTHTAETGAILPAQGG